MIADLRRVRARLLFLILLAFIATVTMASAAAYDFKVVRASNDEIQTIELVDTSAGQVVQGAEIYVVRTEYAEDHKRAPSIRRVFIPLEDYLRGNYAHRQSEPPTSRELTVMAKVPGRFWTVWGTVDLGD